MNLLQTASINKGVEKSQNEGKFPVYRLELLLFYLCTRLQKATLWSSKEVCGFIPCHILYVSASIGSLDRSKSRSGN